MWYSLKNVKLLPYLPITATSLQRPFYSVPKWPLWRGSTAFFAHAIVVLKLKIYSIGARSKTRALLFLCDTGSLLPET